MVLLLVHLGETLLWRWHILFKTNIINCECLLLLRMKFTLGKHQKLKSRKAITELFEVGKSIKEYPIKIIYVPVAQPHEQITKVAFSVPKRNFKHAVDRNRVKRLLREAYRLHQHQYFKEDDQAYHIMFIYIKNTLPSYLEIEKKLKKALSKFKVATTILPS